MGPEVSRLADPRQGHFDLGTGFHGAAMLALGRAATVVTTALGLPFHALASLPSQVWPAGNCDLCNSGIALEQATI